MLELEEKVALAINLQKFIYGDFAKVMRFKTRKEFNEKVKDFGLVYSIAFKNEIFADILENNFVLFINAYVVFDLTDDRNKLKDYPYCDASSYIVQNRYQLKLVTEKRVVIIIEEEIDSYIEELRHKTKYF